MGGDKNVYVIRGLNSEERFGSSGSDHRGQGRWIDRSRFHCPSIDRETEGLIPDSVGAAATSPPILSPCKSLAGLGPFGYPSNWRVFGPQK